MTRVLSEGRARRGWDWEVARGCLVVVLFVLVVWTAVAAVTLAMWGLL